MNFQEYESKYEALYAEFAAVVKSILEKAIATTDDLRPQSIQHRAKTAQSLKARLESAGFLQSEHIEQERKDLAGVRVIFYTNNDVDRFLNSRLIVTNFEIDRAATKIHHPTKENAETRYRAIHYTVGLSEDRAKLAEYAKFKGLRCEIQIQTILNHAWSETSHDIVYKDKPREGFGNKAMESITNRFNQIMDKYLLPAGYEFQQIQHDHNRLQQGKELFDRDAIRSLETAKNNNERHELLTSLKENALPNYDDISAIFGDLSGPLVGTAKASRGSPPEPIKTAFGDLKGKTAADVTTLIIEIFDMLRYVDIERTFAALCEIFRDEPDKDVRKRVLDAIRNLAAYDLTVWEKVGPSVQLALVDIIDRMEIAEQIALRPIIFAVWGKVLESDIEGTSWAVDSVTLSSGAVPASDHLKSIRAKAMASLFNLFEKFDSEADKREVINALRQATRTPSRSEPSNELRVLVLLDAKQIVDFLIGKAKTLSYELLESLEHDFLFDYHRAQELAEAENDKFGCRSAANGLIQSIIGFRDAINADQQYVRYKTLVGFESVFAGHWDEEDFDYAKIEKFRTTAAESFLEEITPENEKEWLALIERCAATKSDDLATFPFFGKFLVRLAQSKPELADKLLGQASQNLFHFLPAFLSGLFQSGAQEIYQKRIEHYLSLGVQLTSLARHWRNSKPGRPLFITAVLKKAIAAGDDIAVIECLVFAIEGNRAETIPKNDVFFVPALKYLTARKDARWVRGAWFLDQAKTFFESATVEESELILENLRALPKIDYQAERILRLIAKSQLPLVWNYLGQRLKDRPEEAGEERYEEFPYQFQGLEKELSRDPKLALATVRGHYEADKTLFRFRGGRLLSTAFPKCPPEFAQELGEMATNGTETDTDFVLAVMENYRGDPSTHEVLKRVVTRYPTNDSKLSHVKISFDNTGVLSGKFGFVNAMREKKEAMALWLQDVRPEVKAFAETHMRELDLRIADEQRRADEHEELRKLQFDSGK